MYEDNEVILIDEDNDDSEELHQETLGDEDDTIVDTASALNMIHSNKSFHWQQFFG